MVGTGEIKYRGGPQLTLLPGSLILIYQGLGKENLDQKSAGPPGWGLMQQARSSLITKKKKEMLKNQTPNVEFYSKNKFEKFLHLVGFITRSYHDSRSPERQICLFSVCILLAIAEVRQAS